MGFLRHKHAVGHLSTIALCVVLVLVLVSVGIARPCAADGLSGSLEYNYSRNYTDTEDSSHRTTKTQTGTFNQRYNLALDKRIYPNLNILASGIFERQDTTFKAEDVENDATRTNIRPFVDLSLRTPLYQAEVSYTRNEEKASTSGTPSSTTIRESYFSTLYWRPDGYPDIKLQYSRDLSYDRDRLSADTITDRYEIISRYQATNAVYLYYQGTLRDIEDRIDKTTVNEMIHNGKVNYSNTWWQRRIALAMDYNFTRNEVKTTTAGIGEVSFRVIPFDGLSAPPNDTPETGALLSNPALKDGDTATGSGINLGLPPPGGDAKSRNMGLDFASETQVNTLFVWVDRDVTQVADAFSWRIFTSRDNLNWILVQTVFPAVYSPTFNRFEIRFATVTSRYVKVVTAPLSPAVPFAAGFPTIQVTELQAEIRKSASEAAGKVGRNSHIGNLNFRAVILEVPNLAYEFSYFITKIDPAASNHTLSNGLSFFHQFNKVFSGAARITREDGREQAGDREAYIYTASVTAVPLETLRQSITISGKEETVAGKKDTSNTLYIHNVAKLYEGIDVVLGASASFTKDDTGKKSDTTQITGGATFIPHRSMTANLLYSGLTTTSEGGELPEKKTDYTRAGEANISFTPFQNLYLYGSYRIEGQSNHPRRNISNYSITWSPFRDGTLHFTFFYNDTIRSEGERERSIVPGLRWYVTPRAYLDFSYQNLRNDTPSLKTSSVIYSGTGRINF